jgi:hypothetical protein
MAKWICPMCERDLSSEKVDLGDGTVVCGECAQAMWSAPIPTRSVVDIPRADVESCGWCGQPLTPDDRGSDHLACIRTRPGLLICLMCSAPVKARVAVDGPDGRFPFHPACVALSRSHHSDRPDIGP